MTRFGLQATGSVAGYRGAGELGGTGAVATAGVHLARDEMLWKVLRMTLADGRLGCVATPDDKFTDNTAENQ